METESAREEAIKVPVVNLDLMILRKYHMYNMPKEALKFYKQIVRVPKAVYHIWLWMQLVVYSLALTDGLKILPFNQSWKV